MLRQPYNYATLFLRNPRTQNEYQYNNATGSPVTLTLGTLIGKIAATGYLVPQVSTATDGSEVPYGVLMQTTTIAANTISNLTILVQGDVARGGLIFGGADTIDTLITTVTTHGRSINDILVSAGIIPVPSTENTYNDN